MANTKVSAFTAVTAVAAADTIPVIQGGVTSKATATMARGYLTNGSVAAVSAGYAADTYLAGSGITIPTAGGWKAGTLYRCEFDMTKTAAGTASFTVTIRMGTLGTTGDAAILSLPLSTGTAAADSGVFDIKAIFRTVGAGTSAVLQGWIRCNHNLTTTGLIQTGAVGVSTATSAGFNSTTQTIIGLSVNGGASFSGTNNMVLAELQGF